LGKALICLLGKAAEELLIPPPTFDKPRLLVF